MKIFPTFEQQIENTMANKKQASTLKAASIYQQIIKWWLVIGVVMVLGQIVLGGITRLTGSGLSITKWDIVTGTLPPLNNQEWSEVFDLYKATPQYAKINAGMSISEFKYIFFWEYTHRLWARLMGFVFAIPFFIFLSKGWLSSALTKRLGITVLLAAIVAAFGWIMVASGLIERPWVNAYKLTMHLSLACVLYSYLLWTTFIEFQPKVKSFPHRVWKKWALALTILLAFQIILGGIMAGTKAGLQFPTWPDMYGAYLPDILLDGSMWNVENFSNYDKTPFLTALIQFLHRTVAYVLTIMGLYFSFYLYKTNHSQHIQKGSILLVIVLVSQILLGIFTVIGCKGSIPVALGVFHQMGGILLLSTILFIDYQLMRK